MTGLNKIGKRGRANLEANRRLKELYQDLGIRYCEIRLPGCLINNYLQFCHRHKRDWYKGNVDLLSDYNQTVIGCQHCHDKIEVDKKLTEKVFNKLRNL